MGGFTCGARNAGFDIVLACDSNKHMVDFYNSIYSGHEVCQRANVSADSVLVQMLKLGVGTFFAGFPCRFIPR
jgi:site-specific DNA-cytosine methylase